MSVDSFSHTSADALNELDPLSRALLDLSLQRGMDDAEIADVLGTDEEAVLEVRVGLLRSLADRLAPEYADADVPELQAVVAERLYAEQPADDTPALEADDVGDEVDEAELEHLPTEEIQDDRPTALHSVIVEPEPTEAEPTEVELTEAEAIEAEATQPEPIQPLEPIEPDPIEPAQPTAKAEAAEQRRRSPLVFLLPLLLAATVAALVVALTSGGDDDKGNSAQPARDSAQPTADKPSAEQPKAKDEPRAVRLDALGGGKASGTATLDGERLKLRLRGLPDPQGGAYQIWLYDSVIDAKPLGSSKDSKIDLDARVPGNATDYEYVDVSLEPADGNPNHSGQSVLRVPVAKLSR